MMCFTRLGHIFLSAVTSSNLFMMFAAVSVLMCRVRIGVRSFSTTLSHVSAGLPRFLCAGLRASSSACLARVLFGTFIIWPSQFSLPSGKIASSSSLHHHHFIITTSSFSCFQPSLSVSRNFLAFSHLKY